MTNLLLYQRIAQQLAEDIRRGVYQPGERVPSVRKMSSQLNVSHATVLQAYANLEDQGLIRAPAVRVLRAPDARAHGAYAGYRAGRAPGAGHP